MHGADQRINFPCKICKRAQAVLHQGTNIGFAGHTNTCGAECTNTCFASCTNTCSLCHYRGGRIDREICSFWSGGQFSLHPPPAFQTLLIQIPNTNTIEIQKYIDWKYATSSVFHLRSLPNIAFKFKRLKNIFWGDSFWNILWLYMAKIWRQNCEGVQRCTAHTLLWGPYKKH